MLATEPKATEPKAGKPKAGEPRAPLRELRELRRAGLAAAAPRVRQLLGEIGELDDVLDAEAAGVLLSTPRARADLAASGAFTPAAVALLSSSTVDALAPLLTAALLREGVLPEVGLAGFNQWRLEIMAGAPALRDLEPQLVACLLDDAAVLDSVADPLDLAEVEARCAAFPAELSAWVTACRRTLTGLTVLCTVPLPPRQYDRHVDAASRARLAAAWHRMNAAICDLADPARSVVVLPADAITDGRAPVFAADRMRLVAATAYAPEFLGSYARELARVLLARLGRTRKCLVLDLDNTVWGGVVGDDGVGALQLGGGYPGNAHAELQDLARDLSRQGVLLAVCSKNDDAVAREAISSHPEMRLRLESFAGFRANWDPKPSNVAALAAELNIGTDAMVFLDDNPAERALMRQLMPQVATAEVPADPAGYASLLGARGDFRLLALTQEDRERTALYQARAEREQFEAGAGSLEDYLAGLGSVLSVEPLDDLNAARIVQLFGKTNQFNLTGHRYSANDLKESGLMFWGARLRDRFGDNGLIAAIAAGREPDGSWQIENFVLSCRVFARSAEHALIGLLLRGAAAAGAPRVRASFVPSAKNARFAGFYAELGFRPGSASPHTFTHSLDPLPALPHWIGVDQPERTFHVA